MACRAMSYTHLALYTHAVSYTQDLLGRTVVVDWAVAKSQYAASKEAGDAGGPPLAAATTFSHTCS
jgi:hypothetical protein